VVNSWVWHVDDVLCLFFVLAYLGLVLAHIDEVFVPTKFLYQLILGLGFGTCKWCFIPTSFLVLAFFCILLCTKKGLDSYVIPWYFLLYHLCNQNIFFVIWNVYVFFMIDVISSMLKSMFNLILMSCFDLVLVNASRSFVVILYFIN